MLSRQKTLHLCVCIILLYYGLFYPTPLSGQEQLALYSCGTIRLLKALASFIFNSLEVLRAASQAARWERSWQSCPAAAGEDVFVSPGTQALAVHSWEHGGEDLRVCVLISRVKRWISAWVHSECVSPAHGKAAQKCGDVPATLISSAGIGHGCAVTDWAVSLLPCISSLCLIHTALGIQEILSTESEEGSCCVTKGLQSIMASTRD